MGDGIIPKHYSMLVTFQEDDLCDETKLEKPLLVDGVHPTHIFFNEALSS